MKRILVLILCFVMVLSVSAFQTEAVDASNDVVSSTDYSVYKVGDAATNEKVAAACFDATVYKGRYSDLSSLSDADAYQHWINTGIKQGRSASVILDIKYYADNNDDLTAVYGNDYESMYYHFITGGYGEKRKSSPLFDAGYYYYNHEDVANAYGDLCIIHFLDYGIYEGRQASETFNVNFYLEINTDIAATWPEDVYMATLHYAGHGLREGRLGYCDPEKVDDIILKPEYSYDSASNTVTKVEGNTTVKEFKSKFYNPNLTVIDCNGKTLSDSDCVGTASVVKLMKGNTELQSMKVLVMGDTDGTGTVDSTDYIRIKNAFLGNVVLKDEFLTSADVDKSSKIDSTDYIQVKSHFLGTFDFYPEEVKPDRIYVSKTGDFWNSYENQVNVIFPGQYVQGLYNYKLYADYNASVDGYVVTKMVASHCSYAEKVKEGSIGLCFAYMPDYAKGFSFGRTQYAVWSKIRPGDIIRPQGINFSNKTIWTRGTFDTASFFSYSYFTVEYAEDYPPKTVYNDQTIVALGDSVTANGGWVEAVSDKIGSHIINSGISGNKTTDALARFDRDVASYSPDVVLITFAINDCVQYYYSDQTVVTYKNELRELYNKCKAIGAKVVFVAPNNIKLSALDYDRYAPYGGIANCYPKFIQAMKEVAAETGSGFVDVYSRFLGLTLNDYLIDTVHPNTAGYAIFTEQISNYLLSNQEKYEK